MRFFCLIIFLPFTVTVSRLGLILSPILKVTEVVSSLTGVLSSTIFNVSPSSLIIEDEPSLKEEVQETPQEEQIVEDGNFPTVEVPNPENKEAMTLGVKLADKIKKYNKNFCNS